jgi:hypothetical protein
MYQYAAWGFFVCGWFFAYASIPAENKMRQQYPLAMGYAILVANGVWFVLLACFVFNGSTYAFSAEASLGYYMLTLAGGFVVLLVLPVMVFMLVKRFNPKAKVWLMKGVLEPFLPEGKPLPTYDGDEDEDEDDAKQDLFREGSSQSIRSGARSLPGTFAFT